MKGLPFSVAMMLAWLAGKKTVTRRLINPQPKNIWYIGWNIDLQKYFFYPLEGSTEKILSIRPRYLPEEIVYIKETWQEVGTFDPGLLVYRASYPECVPSYFENIPDIKEIKWKLSIFMPESASRSKALVISARPERLHHITEDDAIAEGLSKITKDNGRTWKYGIPDRDGLPGTDDYGWEWENWKVSPIDAYQYLWDSINAKKHPWSSNPWVWRYELERIQ
ncbi:MAG: hypothetical protein ABFD50_19005 [Smithella sp.]